jgi:hypothetical protein
LAAGLSARYSHGRRLGCYAAQAVDIPEGFARQGLVMAVRLVGRVLFAVVAVAAAVACGGGGGGSTATDGGSQEAGIDASVGAEASVVDATADVAAEVGVADAASNPPVDAPFEFDGFARPDGSGDAAYCPDDDGDGWTVCNGDCNDHDSQINPCAFDTNDPSDPVGHDGVDNDCDGFVDNLVTCESALAGGFDTSPVHHANAANICDNPRCPRLVQSKAVWYGPSPKNAQRVTAHVGTSGVFVPRTLPANPAGAPAATNSYMSFLSSGTAWDESDTGASSYATCPGTDFGVTYSNAWALPSSQNTNPCGTGVDESTVSVHDYTELRMTLRAPSNAGSFAFDFAFFSEEFPYYVCQGYNDTFLAIQTSKQFEAAYPQGYEIAYDGNGHRINVNNLFFQDCSYCDDCVAGSNFIAACPNGVSALKGTFFERPLGPDSAGIQCNASHGSGGTDWLTTTSPIQPGETFTLSFIIFDENDGILDSSVVVDHFRWHSTTLGSPVTGR